MDRKYDKPSARTIIYWLIQDEKIDSESLFSFLELCWPSFFIKDGFVFLKEEFSEEMYDNLIKENENPEYWINLFTINDFFTQIEDEEEKSKNVIKILAEAWHQKLKKDFPGMTFIVECLWSEEYGDCGLTFYQTEKFDSQQIAQSFHAIATPNVKENKMNQSSEGARPGISKIRKPLFDEFPKSC